MVGDGITDLEAVQQGGGADLFVGFGGAGALGQGQSGRRRREDTAIRQRARTCLPPAIVERSSLCMHARLSLPLWPCLQAWWRGKW